MLQDHIAQVKGAIQVARKIKVRKEYQEKGRWENALRAIEGDRQQVKERCEKEKEARRRGPENPRGGGDTGNRTGRESPLSSCSSENDEFYNCFE